MRFAYTPMSWLSGVARARPRRTHSAILEATHCSRDPPCRLADAPCPTCSSRPAETTMSSACRSRDRPFVIALRQAAPEGGHHITEHGEKTAGSFRHCQQPPSGQAGSRLGLAAASHHPRRGPPARSIRPWQAAGCGRGGARSSRVRLGSAGAWAPGEGARASGGAQSRVSPSARSRPRAAARARAPGLLGLRPSVDERRLAREAP